MSEHSPGFLRLVDDAKSRIEEIAAADVPALLRRSPTALLIDTREDHEWQAGHLRDALHLSKGTIERDIEARVPDTGAPLLLYCGGGFRSALVADNLRKMGYQHAISIAGGWRELREILPLA